MPIKPKQKGEKLKTLSIRNPWAYLVAYGVKDVENRSWKTDYRGDFLIHCSGKPDDWPYHSDLPPRVLERVRKNRAMKTPFEKLDPDLKGWVRLFNFCVSHYHLPEVMPDDREQSDKMARDALKEFGPALRSGAIIGQATLVDIVYNKSKSHWAEKNAFHWIVENPKVFDEPILDVKGKLKLWDYSLPI
jgi:hypothetical protein